MKHDDKHPSSLLNTIRTALNSSPPAIAESGTLRLHTLFSIPRHVKSLYPLAHIHPTDLEYNKKSASIAAYEEQIFITASWAPLASSSSDQAGASEDVANQTGAPLLVLAMELYLYTLPEMGSAVLYISKLDSSGWAPQGIPSALRDALGAQVLGAGQKFGNTLTATLTSAVTQHFSTFRHWDSHPDRVTISHLSVHILARSQRAYLFPSSPENKNKKVLSDGGLIKWWRSVMSHVISCTRNNDSIDARPYYLIPGYSRLESHPLVPLIREDTKDTILKEAQWTYGHPYSSVGASCSEADLPPLPLHWRNSSFVRGNKGNAGVVEDEQGEYDPRKVRSVPTLMPHFSDDPKTRFLDEMARDAHEHSGWKKKGAQEKETDVTKEEKANGIDVVKLKTSEDGIKKRTVEESDHSKEDEKESKRAKTDNSTFTPSTTTTTTTTIPLVTLRALTRERCAMDDLPIDEFWERMAFRQECCSGNAVGVLVILFTRQPSSSSSSLSTCMVERQPLSLPYKVLSDLVFKSLMKDTCEWNKISLARTLTQAWAQGVDREVRRKGGVSQFLPVQAKEAEGLIGQGLIWTDILLKGPTKQQLEKAKLEEEAKSKTNDQATMTASNATGATTTTMLSVKRRKKPTA
ncbi:uncharacterized protein UTRI_02766 [Ustilago trichophora]|uniref:histone acetyltransferase n=1 Tax=Ustilago trichophora TaxID=86804 RepID=A0A5C3ES70_9BASI|nr:uncharacterized protein UTRI_02766 [Ustilago trichophora]